MPDKHEVTLGNRGHDSSKTVTGSVKDYVKKEKKHGGFRKLFFRKKKKHKPSDKNGGHGSISPASSPSHPKFGLKHYSPSNKNNGVHPGTNKTEIYVEDPEKISSKLDLGTEDIGIGNSSDSSGGSFEISVTKSAGNSPERRQGEDRRLNDEYHPGELVATKKTKRSRSIGNISDLPRDRRDSGSVLIAEYRIANKYSTLPKANTTLEPGHRTSLSQQEWERGEDIARILQLRENSLRRLTRTSDDMEADIEKLRRAYKRNRLKYVCGNCCPCIFYA